MNKIFELTITLYVVFRILLIFAHLTVSLPTHSSFDKHANRTSRWYLTVRSPSPDGLEKAKHKLPIVKVQAAPEGLNKMPQH